MLNFYCVLKNNHIFMKKIYFIIPLALLVLSGCSVSLFNKESNQITEEVPEVAYILPEIYQEEEDKIPETPVVNKGVISLETINSEIPAERQVVIKDNGEEIFRFSYGTEGLTDAEVSLISQSGNNIYFFTALTGFGGCIYSEYNVKTFYSFDLSSRELKTIADKVSYISLSADFSLAGYVQGEFYVIKDLNSGFEKKMPFPANAVKYRDWSLSSDGQDVSMIGYVGANDSGCFWDDKSPAAEEAYVWNLATNALDKVASGPVGLEKPLR